MKSEEGILCLDHLTSYITEKNHPRLDKQMLPRSKAKKHNLLGCPHRQQLLRSGHYELYLSALYALSRSLSLNSAARGVNTASQCFPLKLLQDHGPGHVKFFRPCQIYNQVQQ